MNNNETIIWAKDLDHLIMVWNRLYKDNGYHIERTIERKFRLSRLSWWYCITISKWYELGIRDFCGNYIESDNNVLDTILNDIKESKCKSAKIKTNNKSVYEQLAYKMNSEGVYPSIDIRIYLDPSMFDNEIKVEYTK